jgi:hypothetical protein
MILLRRFGIIGQGCGNVKCHPSAIFITPSQIVLGICIPLICGQRVVMNSFVVVLLDTLSIGITARYVEQFLRGFPISCKVFND